MAFGLIVLTPPLTLDPSAAIAACRARALGVLDAEHARDPAAAADALATLARLGRGECGVRVGADGALARALVVALPAEARLLVVGPEALAAAPEELRRAQARGVRILLEATGEADARAGEAFGVDGLVARGLEAGGFVGDETTFVLLQRLLARSRLPVWAHGGIGLHTAAACRAGGAAGVVLDVQVALTPESGLPTPVRAALARTDGSETVAVGPGLGNDLRAFGRAGTARLDELRALAAELRDDPRPAATRRAVWREAVGQRLGWDEDEIWPVGQDAAFAAPLAAHFRTVGGIVAAVREAVAEHLDAACRLRPLAADAPLARSHGTRYPILQGPMTRVSDVPAFARSVAEAGALPFLALALMRGDEVRRLLETTARLLGDRPWGVGILGFVPLALRQEQVEAIMAVRPPFALIAGGRPDQALALERAGIPTYLHVPSPALLRMFLDAGARRFVFEGRECGGHVGPRSSFVLWDTMIDVLLEHVPAAAAEACHVVFAGGIHDAVSAAMVAAAAAPLAARGMRVGVLMGTAYLFTEEAVREGAVVPGFQAEALRCTRTVLLETGPGHATRCAATPFAETFERERRRLLAEGRSPEEVRDALEALNLGRLRVAAKGLARRAAGAGAPSALAPVDDAEQRCEGLYMLGQVAALRDRTLTVAALHREVAEDGTARLLAHAPAIVERPAPPPRPADVAIVGMACFMPGAADVETFWANILHGVDAIQEVPPERFDWRRYFDPDPRARDRIYGRWGGFLAPVAFDPARYGMPPASLRSIEPLQLLVLEAARRALQDAGYDVRPFPRARTGVIVGVGGGIGDLGQRYIVRAALPSYVEPVPETLLERLPEWTEDSFAGIILNVAAGRVANRLDLGGVNYAVDAACASSLAALYAALRELESGAADMMLVAGADTVQNPFGYLCFAKTRALSPRGRCRPFDETADGIVISEGVAVVVLKRLADAERDGDRIYAVIKAVGGSSDGRDRSMTAPRPEGQLLALERAYRAAGIAPATVELIEAHGTGTVAGDQAELAALTRMFGAADGRPAWCAVGSVKSMIGHTKCAAGLAGLIKVARALYHRVLPPTLGVERPNARAGFGAGPFYVNTRARPWVPAGEHPRRAGVSSFGFGGTNFHAVLEEYVDVCPAAAPRAAAGPWPAELFLVAGLTRAELLAGLDALRRDLERPRALRRRAAAAWETARAVLRRAADAAVLAVVAADDDDLAAKLAAARGRLEAGAEAIDDPADVYFSATPLGRTGQVAFLFPGQGSQYPEMLRDLAVAFDEVRGSFERATRVLAGRFAEPLARLVFPPPAFTPDAARAQEEALKDTRVAQPALGAAGLGVFRLLAALGVHPHAAAGHSYGEYVALAAAGALDEAELFRLSEARGAAIVEGVGDEPGTMAAVAAGAAEVAAVLDGVSGVWLANLNAPRQTVISGTRAGVEQALARLAAAGLTARPIPVACAFHSPLLAAAARRFASRLEASRFAAPRFPVYGNADAAPYPPDPAEVARRLAAHLLEPVRFVDQIHAMYAAGCRVFVEVGPRNVLTGLVRQALDGRPALAVATDVPGRDGRVTLLHALGQLAAHGVRVSLDRLFAGRLEGAEDAAPAPTAWLVTGGHAWPLRGEAPRALAPVQLGRDGLADAAARGGEGRDAAEAAVRPAPGDRAGSAPPAPPSRPAGPEPTGPAAAPPPTVAVPADGAEAEILLEFQRTMARFLETQRHVMLAFLGADGAGQGARMPLTVTPDAQAVAASATPAPRAEAVVGAPDAEGLVARVEAPSAGPAPDDLAGLLVRVASERTGYPPEMLGLDAALEADLGIDSIKRVEILGALQHAAGEPLATRVRESMEALSRARTLRELLALLASEAPGDGRAPAAARDDGLDPDTLRRLLLEVASERTGYPPEMLGLDAALEADLGIDSIKRVEILGAVQRRLPPARAAAVQAALERLTTARTLRAILEALLALDGPTGASTRPAPDEAAPAAPRPAAAATLSDGVPRGGGDGAFTAGREDAPEAPASVDAQPPAAHGADATLAGAACADASAPRCVLTVEEAPAPPRAPVQPPGAVVVTEDALGVAGEIARALARRGIPVALFATRPEDAGAPDRAGRVDAPAGERGEPGEGTDERGGITRLAVALDDPEEVARALATVRARHGTVGGVVHLSALGRPVDPLRAPWEAWRAAIARDVKGLYHLLHGAAADLAAPGAVVIAAVTLDGGFGCLGQGVHSPATAGIGGLVKTAAEEWPAARCKVVDVGVGDAAAATAAVLAELDAADGEVEVGYDRGRRLLPRLRSAPHDPAAEPAALLGPEAVVLITGGARGITAEVAEELARRYRPTLVLVGRQPLPEPEEPAETARLSSVAELRAALIARARAAGRPATPGEIEATVRALLRDREVRRRLAGMRAAGARVVYHQVDVRDAPALMALVETLYREYGRLDAVVHGAGVIEDRLLADKAPASFDRVFDTKVVAAWALARALRPEGLRLVVFFASVAGRFGNRGQADYAAANETLSKLARALDAAWPARVVAIAWGPWAGGGMVSEGVARQFAARGIGLVDPAAGRRAFDDEVTRGRKGEAEVVVGRGPWLRVAETARVVAPSGAATPILGPPALRGATLEAPHALDPSRDLYLDDHRLDGRPVLPAAMAVELMAELAARGWPELRVAEVRGFRLLRGLVLHDGPRPLTVRATPSTHVEDGTIEVDVEIVDPAASVPAYRGTVVLAARWPDAPPAPFAEVDRLEPFPLGAAGAYAELLFHGPRWQCLTDIAGLSETGIVATVRASTPAACLAAPAADAWVLDPVVVDAAPQLAIVWARVRRGITPLPARFARLRVFGPLSPDERLTVHLRVDRSAPAQVVVADAWFLGADGRARLVLEGLEAPASPALNRLGGRRG